MPWHIEIWKEAIRNKIQLMGETSLDEINFCLIFEFDSFQYFQHSINELMVNCWFGLVV